MVRATNTGRPRDPRSDEAILEAARELLAEGGVRRLTVEGVAARAGVAKTTVYRRWRSRNELALALLVELAGRIMPVPDLGETRAELLALVDATVQALDGTLLGRLTREFVSELPRNDALAAAFEQGIVAVRRAEVERAVARGIARGELRPDADYELAPELLVGPVYYRLFFSPAPLGPVFAARIVDVVLHGFAVR